MSDMPTVASSFELTPQAPPPLERVEIVVVGRDALGIDVCKRLVEAGRRVAAIWSPDSNLDEMEQLDVERVVGDARREPVLSRAGIRLAHTILAVTSDDQYNLRVALAARDLNPDIRIVLRQFNRRLGRKITAQLANSEAVSPETHSAATYAASCLNRWVYHALEFPRYSEELIVFCRGTAAEFECASATVHDLQLRRGWHVLAIDDARFPDSGAVTGASSTLTIACKLEAAPAHAPIAEPDKAVARTIEFEHHRRGLGHALRHMRIDPIFVGLSTAIVALVAISTYFFHHELGLRWIEAFYHVANTVTTTGADPGVRPTPDSVRVVDIILMFGSVSIVGALLAYVTAAITRHSIELAQGRHRVYGSNHVVVCGFGNVGSRVVLYLLNQGRRVAVIDRHPDDALASEARVRGAHIMTADATSESALALANVPEAAAVLALTDSDSANLEIALTAGAFAPGIPVIMRISEPAMAKAVERHFLIRASYSAAALAAPLVAGLALERGSRGTVDVAGVDYPLAQRKRSAMTIDASELVLSTSGDDVLVLRKALG